jgi:hypothetical protein
MRYTRSDQVTIADVIVESTKYGNLHLRAIATEAVLKVCNNLRLQLEFILQCLDEVANTSLDRVTTPDPFLVLVPFLFRIIRTTIEASLEVLGDLTVDFNYLFLVAAINGLFDFLFHIFVGFI